MYFNLIGAVVRPNKGEIVTSRKDLLVVVTQVKRLAPMRGKKENLTY